MNNINKRIKTLIGQLSISEKVGQLFMLAYTGKDLDYAKTLIRDFNVGGFYISNDNADNHQAAFELCQSLNFEAQKRVCDAPLLLGVDQEGSWSVLSKTSVTGPGNLALGAADNVALTQSVYRMFATEMAAVGYNTVLGPCADVNSNPLNPIIGVRAFGEEVQPVTKHVSAAVKGLRQGNVMSAAKHFPGHGDTAEDTHRQLPSVDKSLKQLLKEDLVPFKAAIEQGVEIMMTAHILYPQIDAEYPATLSSKILQGVLRKKLDFKGIILTDSMNMWAMRKNYDPAQAAVMAFKAGANIVMLSEEYYENSLGDYKQKQQATIAGVIEAVENGEIEESVIDESLALVLNYKYQSAAFADVSELDPKAYGNKQHLQLAYDSAYSAIKVLRNECEQWPLQRQKYYLIPTSNPKMQQQILECRGIGPNDERLVIDVLTDQLNILKSHYKLVDYEFINHFLESDNSDNLPIVLITENYPIAGYDHDVDEQAAIVNKLVKKYADRVIVLALRSAYELEQYPELKTYVCGFSSRPVSAVAIANMLAGKR